MRLSDFDYNLPKDLIAQYPVERRSDCRLLVLDRKDKRIYDRTFYDILDYFKKGDCLVLNNTKVKPCRLIGQKLNTGGKVDVLFLDRVGKNIYKCLIKTNHRLNDATHIAFSNDLIGRFLETDSNTSIIEFNRESLKHFLDKRGLMPLPPYIKRPPDKNDKILYQTVFAKICGAVASPTAGLHFTKDLLNKLSRKGVKILYVTLHVNYATFKPVEVDDITKHKMYTEYFILPEKTADQINNSKKNGGRIIAVGTTTIRVLESAVRNSGSKSLGLKSRRGWTDLFIYPPYDFKIADMLLTNFHMPKTTLLMLVSAFINQSRGGGSVCRHRGIKGKDLLLKAYMYAIKRHYRFLSYGDAMLII